MKRAALFLALALLLLRVAFLGLPDLFPEEAYYWNYAKHLDFGYLDHPPMVAWLIHLGTSIFGDGELGIRIFAVGSALVTVFFAWRLTELLYDRAAAVQAVLLVSVLPFFFMTGFMMTPDAPLVACWAGALYFLARALLQDRASAWVGVGICLGLGMLSKYTIALLGPATLVFMTLDPAARRWWRHPAPYAAVALALAIFSPVILWNAQHQWASFAFQSAGRVAEAWRFSTHELLLSILALLTPVGVALAGNSLFRSASLETEARRRQLFVRTCTLVPLAVFLLFSFTHRVKLNWTGPLWLAVIPAMAVAVSGLTNSGPSGLRRAWIGTVALLFLTAALFLQYLAFGLPGIGHPKDMALLPVGWSEMGRSLELQRAAVPRPANGRVLLVGLDRNFIASEAAFYHSRQSDSVQETTGAHLFGGPALMYEFWFSPAELSGATLLLVSFERTDLDRRRIRKRSGGQGEIIEHTLERHGKKLRPFYTRVVTDYRPAAISEKPSKP